MEPSSALELQWVWKKKKKKKPERKAVEMGEQKVEPELVVIAAFTVTAIPQSPLSYLALWVMGTVLTPQWVRRGPISNFSEKLFPRVGSPYRLRTGCWCQCGLSRPKLLPSLPRQKASSVLKFFEVFSYDSLKSASVNSPHRV